MATDALQPCHKGTPALTAAQVSAALKQLSDWQYVSTQDKDFLQRSYSFSNYAKALTFTNQVAALAEAADHHPTITLEWGKVSICWWTHTIDGVHQNDLIMAARCDRLQGNDQ